MKAWLTRLHVLWQMQRGLLGHYGWWRALRAGRPVDAAGEPLPWIPYPAIDFLAQFDFSNATVFEWGSGYSTLWWAKRCKHVVSVESNTPWVPYIKTLLPPSVELIETPFEAEIEAGAITRHATAAFDVIAIDNNGPFRWCCAEAAVEKLAPGGMIILDNSDQCLKACAVLRGHGLTQVDFTGFVPGGGYAHTASIFFRGALNFAPLGDWPKRSVAQPNPPWENC